MDSDTSRYDAAVQVSCNARKTDFADAFAATGNALDSLAKDPRDSLPERDVRDAKETARCNQSRRRALEVIHRKC
jgi:hypothetical protein